MAKDPIIEPGKLLAALDFAAETAAREEEHRERFVALIRSLLDVVDSFDRVLAGGNEDVQGGVSLKTVELLARQLENKLARAGVTPIECVDQPVNPERHEIVTVRETTDAPDNVIVEVLTRGFEWNGVAVRRPRVVVAHHSEEEA